MTKHIVWSQSVSTFTVPLVQLPGSSIDLDFADGQYFGSTLSSLLSCSRAYGGFVTSAAGGLSWCSPNTLRIGAGKGLLIEEGSTNLLYPSDGSGWNAITGGTGTCVITQNYALGPDGSLSATRLQMNVNSDFALAQINIPGSYSAGAYVGSIYMKSNNTSYYQITLFNDNGTQTAVAITPQWQRYEATEFLQATTGTKFHVLPAVTGAVDISVWGPQLEFFGANRLTTAAWAPVVGATGTCVITNNFADGPDGSTLTATRLQMSPNSDFALAQKLYIGDTDLIGYYTGSIWLKSNTGSSYAVNIFDDRGTVVTVTATPTWQQFTQTELYTPNPFEFQVISTQNSTDILVWGEMVTNYPTFATSYIQTTAGGPLSRDADIVTLIGGAATILGGAALSLAARLSPIPDSGVSIFEHTGNDGYAFGLWDSAFGEYGVISSNGVTLLEQTVPAVYFGATHTLTAGFDNTGRTVAADNASASDAVNITGGFLPQLLPQGHVYLARFTMWNSRLSDATLKTFTMM